MDRKNLIEIIGNGDWITFIIHDDTENEENSDKQKVNLGDYSSKTFNIVVTWDFTGDSGIERIYFNGQLKRDASIDTIPSVTNTLILIGEITDLKISDKWEDR